MKATGLLFHDVIPSGRYELSGFQSADANIYKLDEAEFDRHLTVIRDSAGVPPGSVHHRAAERVLITFDDGGSSMMHVADALDRHGWPGHMFVTTDRIGTLGFLNSNEIRELHGRGHVIGSHSCTHPLRMGACTDAQLDREWRDSVARLQEILGTRVDVASIPGGQYSRRIPPAASAAGIRHLFTSEPTVSVRTVGGCEVYGRFSVQQGVQAAWVASVLRGDRLPMLRSFVFWNAKKALKMAGGDAWLAARRRIIARRSGT